MARVTGQRIAIAGAGLMGRLLAWRLALLGHSVHLFDTDSIKSPKNAAHTAAAMISPLSEVVVSERLIYDMGMQSLAIWPKWIAELNHQQHPIISYSDQDSLVIAHPQDEAELQQFYQDLIHHLGAEHGARWLNRAELKQLEPDLASNFARGLLLPFEAHLDNRQLLDNLLAQLNQLGVQLHEHTSINLDTPDQYGQFNLWLDCRGTGAKDGPTPQIVRGVRGEVLWVHTEEVHLNRPIRLMHPRYKLYIVPKPGGRFIIGATELESEDRSPMSLQSLLELGSALYTLNPAFAEARILELDANLRPSLMDNLPHIDNGQLNNGCPFVRVNGLYRHGYLLAPCLVGRVLEEIVWLA
ncbi:MAG TPA: glycine oxidase ThiO [Cellvibrionaceae bacterium]|nr:glycine oxidase ThiO [Cellvibrionaceae bacterium]